ncbi:MAG: transposase [Betaproteobacteria bacterium]|nr:transposase [Betaproteobacteria bacterium]
MTSLHDRHRRIKEDGAIANERLKQDGAGNVVLQLKSPWRDGATHIVLSPLEFMQRLAALVPRPRLHLIRFHGAPARMGWARLLKRVFDLECVAW